MSKRRPRKQDERRKPEARLSEGAKQWLVRNLLLFGVILILALGIVAGNEIFFLFLFFLSTTLLGLVAIGLACRPFSQGFSNPAAMYYGAVAAGCSLTIFLVNLVSYAIPFAWSVVLGHVLGFLAVFFCWCGSKGFREEARKGCAHFRKFRPTIPRLPLSPVWWAVVLTLALVACAKFFLTTFDFRAHHAFIGTIAHGNFPVMYPYAPDEPLAYPYGFNLLAALPYRATGWDIGFVAGMVGVWVFLGAALAVVGFMKAYFSARSAVSVVGVLFYFFGSSLTGVAVVLTHGPFLTRAVLPELSAVSALPYSQFSHGLGRSVGYALLPALLLLVEAFWKRRLGGSLLPWFVLVACLMASLGLTAPELLAVLGLAMVVVVLKDIGGGKEGAARKAVLVGVLALSLLLSFLQGGFFSSGFFSSGDENIHLENEHAVQKSPYRNMEDKFYLMWPPAVPTWNEKAMYATVFSPVFWRVALLEFGPLFLLFPYFLRPGGDSFRQILMLAVCISLGVAFLVGYRIDEFNMSKFFQVPMLIVQLFAGSFLVRVVYRWVTKPAVRRRALAVLVSAMILAPVGYWIGSLWFYGSKAPYAAEDSKIDAIVSDLKRRVPPLARIITIAAFIYPLHKEGYFALHNPPPLRFYLDSDGMENFDASLKFRTRETFLAWRPDYLLVPEDVLRHFQAVLPEVSTTVLWRYDVQQRDTLYIVEVQNP